MRRVSLCESGDQLVKAVPILMSPGEALRAWPGRLEEVSESPAEMVGESGSILTGTRPVRARRRRLSASTPRASPALVEMTPMSWLVLEELVLVRIGTP